jgi:hypothetical protein
VVRTVARIKVKAAPQSTNEGKNFGFTLGRSQICPVSS